MRSATHSSLLPEEVREGCRKEAKLRLSPEASGGSREAWQRLAEGDPRGKSCTFEECGCDTHGPQWLCFFFRGVTDTYHNAVDPGTIRRPGASTSHKVKNPRITSDPSLNY